MLDIATITMLQMEVVNDQSYDKTTHTLIPDPVLLNMVPDFKSTISDVYKSYQQIIIQDYNLNTNYLEQVNYDAQTQEVSYLYFDLGDEYVRRLTIKCKQLGKDKKKDNQVVAVKKLYQLRFDLSSAQEDGNKLDVFIDTFRMQDQYQRLKYWISNKVRRGCRYIDVLSPNNREFLISLDIPNLTKAVEELKFADRLMVLSGYSYD